MNDTEQTPNPAFEAARTELTDIFTNPNNPHHAGYHRNDPKAMEYVNGLYTKGQSTKPAATRGSVTVAENMDGLHPHLTGRDTTPHEAQAEDRRETGPEESSPEDTMAAAEVDTMLRNVLGDGYDTEMRDMRIGARTLFGGEGGIELFDALNGIFSTLPANEQAEAQVAGVRFLAHFGRLAQRRS